MVAVEGVEEEELDTDKGIAFVAPICSSKGAIIFPWGVFSNVYS